jgi:ATP-dependent Clp protease protease subunit
VLLHQPSAGGQGTVTDLGLQADELLRVRAHVEEVLGRHTGRSVQQLRRDTDRDEVLTAAEAVDFGIVDEVVERASEARVGAL